MGIQNRVVAGFCGSRHLILYASDAIEDAH